MRTTIREQVTNEVEYYLSCVENQNDQIQEQCESEKGFDVSKWWAEHHEKFPKMALVFKAILCISATSANCEHAFSTLTDVVTKKRNRLKGETTHKLTFCKHNLALMPDYTTNIKQTTKQDENISDVDEW